MVLDIALLANEMRLKRLHRHFPIYEGANPHVMHEYLVKDRQLGWINSPGNYAPGEGAPGSLTIWSNGQRASSANPQRSTAFNIAVLGGTYTFGNGVSDEETYCWLLNERFPYATFHNYGVHEYGLCQCLQTLKKILESDTLNLDMVIYSMQRRDRTMDLDERYFVQPDATVLCYSALDPNTYSRTLSYWRLPLEHTLLTVSDFKMHYAFSKEKEAQAHRESLDLEFSETETHIIAEMRDSCAKHKINFMINDLEEDNTVMSAPLRRLIEKSKIDYFNNSLPPEEEKIPERHDTEAGYVPKTKFKFHNNKPNYSPNADAHRLWAYRLSEMFLASDVYKVPLNKRDSEDVAAAKKLTPQHKGETTKNTAQH